MIKRPVQTSRFSDAQRRVLDKIGHALKRRKIDFDTAAELSDMVKAGQAEKALWKLMFGLDDNPN